MASSSRTAVTGVYPSSRRKPPRVLIVDDEVSMRDFVDQVLRDAGYLTVRALDGPDALDIDGLFGPFDLLLTDEFMPHMQGHVLAERLRQREPDLKVLYLTAYAERVFAAKGALSSGEALLEKPSTVENILRAISRLMNDHSRPAQT
jgi:two-component system, cell cycle sensor histidine kinase and response regulator CckA